MKIIIIDRQTKKMNFGLKSGFLHVGGVQGDSYRAGGRNSSKS